MEPLHLPWPDSRLSGNARRDRRSLTALRRAAREVGWLVVKEAGLKLPAVPLRLSLLICPPDRRRRDWDNIGAAFKSYQDGIFMALQIDDGLIRGVTLDWGAIERGGAIYVTLEELEPK